MATKYIDGKFVCTYEQVSTFVVSNKNHRTSFSFEKADKQGGDIATYFCTPEGEVLNLLLGPVKGEELLAGAKLAREIFEKISKLESIEAKKDQVRKLHLRQFIESNESIYKVLNYINPNVGPYQNIDDQIRDLKLDRLETNRAAQKICTAIRATGFHSKLRGSLFSSFLPFENIAAIEKPVIEILLRQKYSRVSNRLTGIKKRFEKAVIEKKPTILIVNDGDRKKIDQLLRNKKVQKKLNGAHLDYANEADIFSIMSSLNVLKDKKEQKQYFYFFDGSGKLLKTMPIMTVNGLLYQIDKLGLAN